MMIRQLVSLIREDDNPRLHRIPFVLLWMLSYLLAWYVIYLYEKLWSFGYLCDVIRQIKIGVLPEGMLVGLLFGLTLAFVQTWLLRQRYGFVPKYWGLATVIGATLAGLGYVRVGIYMGVRPDDYVNNFILWFGILGFFQAVALMPVNRRAWLMLGSGCLASAVAVIPHVYPPPFYFSPKYSLLFGTTIQALGTVLIVLYVMTYPRVGVVPKRKKVEKPQRILEGRISTKAFILWWIAFYVVGLALAWIVTELSRFLADISRLEQFSQLEFIWHIFSEWYLSAIYYALIGLVVAAAQDWLMKKHRNLTFPYWRILTVIGWVIAGILSWERFYNPHSLIVNYLLILGYFAMPTLIQTIPMTVYMQRGWMWGVIGIVNGLVFLYFQYLYWHWYGMLFAGFTLYLMTAYAFHRLQPRHPESLQPV